MRKPSQTRQLDLIPDQRLAEACAVFDAGDRAKGFTLLEALARTGSTTAMILLARFFNTGEVPGIRRDYEQALYWLKRAYANGCVDAAIELHKVYGFGKLGVKVDEEKAFRYVTMFERIEHPNIYEAQGVFLAARAYEVGRGTGRNISTALQLYRRAAAAGHLPSKINLARRQVLCGNLLAIVPWTIAVFQAQSLVLLKGPKKAWKDVRMQV